MKTIIDSPKLKRRARLSHIASISGLMVLLIGLVTPFFLPKLAVLSQILVLLGIVLSVVGIFFANRWARRPRPEESLAEALGGLSDSFILYCYTSLPAKHVLLTPNGVVALHTINLAGEFSYIGGHWKEKLGLGRLLRYVLEEHLGDPTRSARAAEDVLKGQLYGSLGVPKSAPVSSVVVFLHPLAQVEVKGAALPVCKVEKLRKTLVSKAPKMDSQTFEQISAFLEKSALGIP